jgi:hypothetical protein
MLITVEFCAIEFLEAGRLQYRSILFRQVNSIGNNLRVEYIHFVCAFFLIMFGQIIKIWKESRTIENHLDAIFRYIPSFYQTIVRISETRITLAPFNVAYV